MFGEQDREQGVALAIVVALAIAISFFAIGIALWLGPLQGGRTAPPATAPAATSAPSEDERVVVYFELSDALVPAVHLLAIETLAARARADTGRRVVISGYHDASGDPAKNAELAKNRAFEVRRALEANGVNPAQIEMRKPALTTGSGSPREARRVELDLQ